MSDIGERAAIALFTRGFPRGANVLGFSDDCAAVPVGRRFLVATTDSIAASTHLPPQATPEDAGWMVAAVNLSDLAAKGATPAGFLLALGLPRNVPVAFLEGVRRGVRSALSRYGCALWGGDMKEHREFTATGTALGWVERARLVRRAGARPGDVVVVTGRLGGASAALEALARGAPRSHGLPLLRPAPRIAEGRLLAGGGATAMTDLSDGLSVGLTQIARESGVGIDVEGDDIPRHPAAGRSPDVAKRARWVLHGGGDYELLATIPRSRLPAARRDFARRSVAPLTAIGRVREGRGVRLRRDGRLSPVSPAGFEHFAVRKR
ncbi:MAG: thiamine-phosphate kinase [Methanobacteriota archaeon]